MFALHALFPDLPRLRGIDVGASPIDGTPPYAPLFEAGHMDLVGFEPDPTQWARLQALGHKNAEYLPHAIGKGGPATLHICAAPGMTSLLRPNMDILRHFHGFPRWGTVVREVPIETTRLDDIPEAQNADYMKVDIQGGEGDLLDGATEALTSMLAVHIEVQFVPFYENQPLFADLDTRLRAAGFMFHRFLPIHSRTFQPMIVGDDIYAGLSQQLWSDAVYFRPFTEFPTMDGASLLKLATLAHDLYGAFDMVGLVLRTLDARDDGDRLTRYMVALARGEVAAEAKAA